MSIRTIALTLRPTPEQETLLCDLQAAFNAACNYTSAVAWERREFRRLPLQDLVYRELRDRFGLLAQLAVRVIAVVADSYRGRPRRPGTMIPRRQRPSGRPSLSVGAIVCRGRCSGMP